MINKNHATIKSTKILVMFEKDMGYNYLFLSQQN